jgi:hypothetical protein
LCGKDVGEKLHGTIVAEESMIVIRSKWGWAANC